MSKISRLIGDYTLCPKKIRQLYTVSGKKGTPIDIARGSFFPRHSVYDKIT